MNFHRSFLFFWIVINFFFLSCDRAVYDPQKIVLRTEILSETKILTQKNLSFAGKRGGLVSLSGFFHKLEILEEATKDGESGYLILKPFSFLRESNPSLGWPSWYAFDAVLVNVGWIPQNGMNHRYKHLNYEEPLFRNPVSIFGRIRNTSSPNIYKKTGVVILKPKREIELWNEIDDKKIASNLPPYALNVLPICLDLIEGD
ncbi:hypothetical protein JWG45_11330 [Leptospira sp. 201903070]|uniref:SURF1-like protein n=1 Tax=Leptospira ainlahdjerensis TaxID=2810033 RepID=A0ABS2UBE1_9LEPT|nr:SURF1 family cytochrome oxidase biogenesis protein [Leptospira ainlahdjerensis]MBM9577676.1 hypothetical protein [Leptospira ainlahdjerensis]MBM9577744.1 hypothetical protein [Leptospira ainlahdjerensis]